MGEGGVRGGRREGEGCEGCEGCEGWMEGRVREKREVKLSSSPGYT